MTNADLLKRIAAAAPILTSHTPLEARLAEIEAHFAKPERDFQLTLTKEDEALLLEGREIKRKLEEAPVVNLTPEQVAFVALLEERYEVVAHGEFEDRDLDLMLAIDDYVRPLHAHVGRKEQRERDEYEFQRGWDAAKEGY